MGSQDVRWAQMASFCQMLDVMDDVINQHNAVFGDDSLLSRSCLPPIRNCDTVRKTSTI